MICSASRNADVIFDSATFLGFGFPMAESITLFDGSPEGSSSLVGIYIGFNADFLAISAAFALPF